MILLKENVLSYLFIHQFNYLFTHYVFHSFLSFLLLSLRLLCNVVSVTDVNLKAKYYFQAYFCNVMSVVELKIKLK